VLTLGINYLDGRLVEIFGTAKDESPETMKIQIAGVVTSTVAPDANGYFSLVAEASSLGQVVAWGIDDEGLYSDKVETFVVSSAPTVVEFVAIEQVDRFWTFTGRVKDESPQGLVVYFDGLKSLIGRSAVVQADGSFSLTVQLREGEGGMASAYTVDWWGLKSDEVFVVVDPS
jgi:hypothetical protein